MEYVIFLAILMSQFQLLFVVIGITLWYCQEVDKGQPLPKFGEWDVNDPSSAEGFTVIFNKARDEKKGATNINGASPTKKDAAGYKQNAYLGKPHSRKWFCCVKSGNADA